jgi:hypothetical protein
VKNTAINVPQNGVRSVTICRIIVITVTLINITALMADNQTKVPQFVSTSVCGVE